MNHEGHTDDPVQQDLNGLQKVKIENLRNAIIKGEKSGAPIDFDMCVFIKDRVKSSKANGK